ncbi:hypothetical protein [Pigmentibacter ruber]|uniref:hypothetical protein n=1 Tax=Pigmentibacter ruber TaxID=2683196 RepID=UPI00131BED7E|nr:hypothetical protein [Pigmentibacter ruber]BFD31035.1 hypothetical protein GTC16762_06530 [Pigmentibacter ruber]
MPFKINIFIFFSTILFLNNSFANEIYVICSNLKNDWKWLNKGNVKIDGNLKTKYLTQSLYFNYFILNGGIETYKNLKNRCFDEFKTEYVYPQPLNKYSNKWIPFAESDEILFPGIISYTDHNFQLRVYYRNSKNKFT